MSKCDVLALFRRVLREGQRWEAKISSETAFEREYIYTEANKQFRRYQKNSLTAEEVSQRLTDAEARLSIALHYRIPYPRLVNVTESDAEHPDLALPISSRSLFELKVDQSEFAAETSAATHVMHDEEDIYFDDPGEGIAPPDDNLLRQASAK